MRLKGAEIIFESLMREGVEVIFGIPGGALLPLYDALPRYPSLRHILVRHEQAAAHAADGYARVTGKVGVCFATSGPGATNLVTGIANAYLDSVPVVAITGQVARAFIGKDAYQEVDMMGISLPITKHNYTIRSAQEIARVIHEAFHLARTGRPGPIHIDMPRDVLVEEADYSYPAKIELPGYKPTLHGHPQQIKRAAKLINEAERPVIISGHGVIISGAEGEVRELSRRAQIPITFTLLGLGALPSDDPLNLGMLGMHGTAWANLAVSRSDLVIAVGMRFDDRATGKPDTFAPQAKIIHIDIDPAEIGKNIRADIPIVGDAKLVLQELLKFVEPRSHEEWLSQIEEWRKLYPIEIPEDEELPPQFVISKISEVMESDGIVVTGVGQHQMWTALLLKHRHPRGLVTSGGLGTMGFELPAAVGAKVGCPDKEVWTVAGDGGFQMTVQELATVVQEKLDIKIAIIDNGYLGMVRQWQELFHERRYVASRLVNPDFVKLAEAYGIPGLRVMKKEEVVPALLKAKEYKGPFLIDFVVEPEEKVFPMVEPGAPLEKFRREEKRER